MVLLFLAHSALAQTPPVQPATGPGGADYAHTGVTVTTHLSGGERYWLYEPSGPVPASAPVVVFLHGYSLLDDGRAVYANMIHHLVKRGNTVVYPRQGNGVEWWNYEDNIVASMVDAEARLSGLGHVDPGPEGYAMVGHSLGGVLALRVAQRAGAAGWPTPAAVAVMDGAGFTTPAYPDMPIEDLSAIAADTFLLAIVAETSFTDPNTQPIVQRLWANTPQIARAQKNILGVRSDNWGSPELVSEHLGVLSGWAVGMGPQPLDAIDWYGYWRPVDALLERAFQGTGGEEALGNGPAARDMGEWSDLVPVEPKITASDLGL